MAQLQVNPTRMELKKIQARYTTARRGHKLLKDKRDELMKQFLDTVREVRSLRAEVEEELMRVHNYGAAWSSFSGARWLLIALTAAGMCAIAWLLVKIVRHPLGQWSLAIILGGGIGNLIDRVRLGYVVDMLDTMFMDFPVFNVADVFVVCGTVCALIYYLAFYSKSDEKNWGNKVDGTDPAANK